MWWDKFSSNINEVIRSALNFLLFFYDKSLHSQKAQKGYKAPKVAKDSFKLFIFYNKILHVQKKYKAPKGTKSIKKYKNTTKQKHKTQMIE